MFSVIVPIYNDWDKARCLLGRLEQIVECTPVTVEVILVDNGSDKATIPGNVPSFAKVVHCETPGSYAARNVGRSHSTQRILAFTDADCLPAGDWLVAARKYYVPGQTSRRIVAGQIEVVPKHQTSINACEAYDMTIGLAQKHYVSKGYGITANLFVSTELFDELGGFDHARYSGGDADFCKRSTTRNAELLFAPDVVVSHPARATWAEHSRKIRRILGAQLTHGSGMARLKWVARAICPPVLDALRVMRSVRPVRARLKLKALMLLFPIWFLRLSEVSRLLVFHGRPRRA